MNVEEELKTLQQWSKGDNRILNNSCEFIIIIIGFFLDKFDVFDKIISTDEAAFGEEGWGFKANKILTKVRGKDFRHEKTKKKRGSYRGGVIDTNVKSFKFDDSEEE